MNQRIKLLAHQADWDNEFREDFDIEKFAELIVKECAQVANDFVPGYGLVPFSKRFNEHFGVEE